MSDHNRVKELDVSIRLLGVKSFHRQDKKVALRRNDKPLTGTERDNYRNELTHLVEIGGAPRVFGEAFLRPCL